MSAANNVNMSAAATHGQLRAAQLRAQGYAAEVAAAAAQAIEAVDNAKEDRHASLVITIPANAWVKQTSGTGPNADPEEGDAWKQYPYYCDIAVETITAADTADIDIVTPCLHAAKLCGFSTSVTTRAGIIRVRAQVQPVAEIRANCTVKKGATS